MRILSLAGGTLLAAITLVLAYYAFDSQDRVRPDLEDGRVTHAARIQVAGTHLPHRKSAESGETGRELRAAKPAGVAQRPQDETEAELIRVDLQLIGPDGEPFRGEVLATLGFAKAKGDPKFIIAQELDDAEPTALRARPEASFRAAPADATGRVSFELARRPGATELILVIRNPLAREPVSGAHSKPNQEVDFEGLRLARIKLPDLGEGRVDLGRVDIKRGALLATGRVTSRMRGLEPLAIEVTAWPLKDGLFGHRVMTVPVDDRGRFRIFAGSSDPVSFSVRPIAQGAEGEHLGLLTRIMPGDRKIEITLREMGRIQGAIDLGSTQATDVQVRIRRPADSNSVWTPITIDPKGAFEVDVAAGSHDLLVLMRGIEVARVEKIDVQPGSVGSADATRLPYLRLAAELTRPAEIILLDQAGAPLEGPVRVRVEREGLQNFAHDHRSDSSGHLIVDVPSRPGPYRVVAGTKAGLRGEARVESFPLVLKLNER